MVTPYAHEIEQSLLGACITDFDSLQDTRELISPECFYLDNHRKIYEALLSVGKSDLILLEQELKDRGEIQEIGKNYVIDLVSLAGFRVAEFCQILVEKKIIRDAIDGAQSVLKKAQSGADAYSIVDEFAKKSENLGLKTTIKHSLTPSEIKERDKDKPKSEKIYTGYSDIDMGIYGDSFRKGQNMLIIADSGHGKTAYAMFLAECFLRRGYKVGWFQLEGYDSETADNIIQSGVQDYDNMFICDTLYDIEDIKRESRRLNREHELDIIFFDYVQNIECNQKISKTEKVEYISKEITKLGKELNVVTNPLSQVTIEESRTGWQQEPRYNDVRWSKQLKQDASSIISIFRPLKIDSLVINREQVKDWNENPVPYDSVYAKQAKVRHGKQEWKRLHLLHTDKGLKPFTEYNNKAPF